MALPVAVGALGTGALARWLGAVLLGWTGKVVMKMPSFVKYILAGLGLNMVVNEVSDNFLGMVIEKFNGAPGVVLETLYYLDVDNYITAIFSAHALVISASVMLRRVAQQP